MSKYTASDFKKLSWNEYIETIELLLEKIESFLEKEKLQIKVVVPILRGAALPAQYLGYKLGVLRFLPVQYKYLKTDTEYGIQKIGKMNMEKNFQVQDGETILVVENNHCFGSTARQVIRDLKNEYPKSKIIYTPVYLDYSSRDKGSVGADYIIFGKYTNETNKASEEDMKKFGLDTKFSLFPWENLDEELAAVNSEKYNYL